MSKIYRVGFLDGVFDLFHVGHLNVIERAKEHCEQLIVGVHGDDIVVSYKSHRPVIGENDRCRIVGAINGVDRAVINRTREKMALWKLYHFDVIFFGDDWEGSDICKRFERELATVGVDVRYLPYTKGISTSSIVEKILREGRG